MPAAQQAFSAEEIALGRLGSAAMHGFRRNGAIEPHRIFASGLIRPEATAKVGKYNRARN
jgi:hypothetical protein